MLIIVHSSVTFVRCLPMCTTTCSALVDSCESVLVNSGEFLDICVSAFVIFYETELVDFGGLVLMIFLNGIDVSL